MHHKPPENASREVTHGQERRLSSATLLQGASRLQIEHRGCTYVLRVTRQGKLILTK